MDDSTIVIGRDDGHKDGGALVLIFNTDRGLGVEIYADGEKTAHYIVDDKTLNQLFADLAGQGFTNRQPTWRFVSRHRPSI